MLLIRIMLTIYRSKTRNFATFVMYKGRVRYVRFVDQGQAYGYSIFKCTDPELCQAIEKLPSFNKLFYLHKQEKPVEKTQEAVVESTATPYPKVKKIQDAIAVLESEYGVSSDSVVSKSDVLRHASKLNISFPNLK